MTVDPARRLTPVVRLAPAKLNLTLAVVGRRPDGYHGLHSVMAPLALADRLSLTPDPSSDGRDTLRVEGFEAGPIADNLVLRALDVTRRAVRPHVASPPPGLAARLAPQFAPSRQAPRHPRVSDADPRPNLCAIGTQCRVCSID